MLTFRRTGQLLMSLLILSITPLTVFADDADDVLAVVQKWAELEVDLEAQAELVTSDRIQVFEICRRTDQDHNLLV